MERMEQTPEEHADVVDISPLRCPACRETVDVEDAYCGHCGMDLLSTKPVLCATCGRALGADVAFCTGCGSGVAPTTTQMPAVYAPPPAAPPMERSEAVLPEPEVEDQTLQDDPRPARPKKRRWKIAAAALAVAMVAAGAAGWWFILRVDPGPYEENLAAGFELVSDVQQATDQIDDPADLEGFDSDVRASIDDVERLETQLDRVEGEDYIDAMDALIEAQFGYLRELDRLADLSSADATPSEYERARELAVELEDSMETALALRPELNVDVPSVSPTPLTTALSKLAEYRREILSERARITRLNATQAKKLESLKGTTAQIDGVLSRYADARSDLANWIDGAKTNGVTYLEAYDVLFQHSSLRQQLRDELAALSVPDPFATDQAAFLAVMDTAINAMDDAIRGIAEYQYDYSYFSYDETPGWIAFEQATDEISEDFSAALSSYETRKATTFRELSRKKPLPSLPD